MFKDFLTSLLQKILEFLGENTDFFALAKEKRQAALKDLSVPESFKQFLLDLKDEKEFFAELRILVGYLHTGSEQEITDSSLFKALIIFLGHELGRKMVVLDSDFYLSSKNERAELVDQILKSTSAMAQALKNILVNFSFQQISTEVNLLTLKVFKEAPQILVQAPTEMDPELKKEIRARLLEEFPYSFPVFQTNKKIIGGIRIFKNGRTTDLSWLSRVTRFTSLTK